MLLFASIEAQEVEIPFTAETPIAVAIPDILTPYESLALLCN